VAVPQVVRITDRLGVYEARRAARVIAAELGFSPADVEVLALATGELAMNLHRYAHGGEILVEVIGAPPNCGVRLTSRDHGPGISDIDAAMRDGFSTGGGLGSGLPGTRRLMDKFDLVTGVTGTTITACKWPSRR
jgi:serine/threonine-protein kinase RsbT